jgi:aminopeptidase N
MFMNPKTHMMKLFSTATYLYLLLAAMVLSPFLSLGKDPYPVNKNLDVLHYTFHLELNDSTDIISGKTEITLALKNNIKSFEIDLVGKKPDGTGMTVTSVGPAVLVESFEQLNGDRVRINLKNSGEKNIQITIEYTGKPGDGLIIGKNKFGDRAFFGDNWPDRGHHWLACIDHPSDKATVSFSVTAPDHYQVVATGALREETAIDKGRKITRYAETVPVPVKVMTMGAARFAVKHTGPVQGVPTSIWVYPQNRDAGFSDFEPETRVIRFFMDQVGPYSFSKLAHVQSKTRWGGLENAGNIFYFENSVTGKGQIENLIAHETAHQWFGNSVTENDWHHVWLSEGFATYFTHLYNEWIYGNDKRKAGMERDRTNILKHELLPKSPVVDTTIRDIGKVLSIITYQKASFVLHMLRKEVGDKAFFSGVRNYYAQFQNSNAMTSDFRQAIEKACGEPLDWFFNQWIFKPGAPDIQVTWEYRTEEKALRLKVRQTGPEVFRFRLEAAIGDSGTEALEIGQREEIFTIKTAKKPASVTLDPGVNLLFSGKIAEGKL